MAMHCADCTACCTVFSVDSIKKAFGEPCRHLTKTPLGPGCGIYAERPVECQHYVCLWIDSQRRSGQEMPEALRPNVCKVVMGWPFGQDRNVLYIYPLSGHENAWRFPPVSEHLKMILSRGGKVMVVIGQKRILLQGDTALSGTEDEFANLLTQGDN